MERYEIKPCKRGLCWILNITSFVKLPELDCEECNQLAKRFQSLGFTTALYTGRYPAHLLRRIVQNVRGYITEADSLFVACLRAHGTRGNIITSDEDQVELKEIIGAFNSDNCPALEGKPRLFFIDACQTHETDELPDENKTKYRATWDYDTEPEADFLLSFSTPPGYTAWLHEKFGSPYLSALLRVLQENAMDPNVDIKQLLTLISSMAAKRDEQDHNDVIVKKQMPCFVSSLTKKLFLTVENECRPEY